MQSSVRRFFAAVVAVLVLSAVVQAQNMRGDIYTPLRSGPYYPYEGLPFSHRYNYPSLPYLYLSTTPEKLQILDAIDREERAEKFSHLRSTKPPIFNRVQDRWRSR